MAADNEDFKQAEQFHTKLVDIASQGNKDQALECASMSDLTETAQYCGRVSNECFKEFLFRIAIALQFGPVQDMPSEGVKGDDPKTWGDDTLTQEAKDDVKKLEDMARRYGESHDESVPVLKDAKDDAGEDPGMTG